VSGFRNVGEEEGGIHASHAAVAAGMGQGASAVDDHLRYGPGTRAGTAETPGHATVPDHPPDGTKGGRGAKSAGEK